MEQKKKFLLIGLFWIVIFAVFIAGKQFTLSTGKEVLLKTVPVDPRDLFRGDYVVLNYEISTVHLNRLKTIGTLNDSGALKGRIVYLPLTVQNGFGVVSGIVDAPPEKGLFIKGRVRDVSNNRLRMEYGIESYFVPEGQGRAIEQLREGLSVKIAVDHFGTASIKSLWVNGKKL